MRPQSTSEEGVSYQMCQPQALDR
ncbi:unnamed protein product [Diplocarpon coronariae]